MSTTHTLFLAPTGPGVGLTSVSIGLVRALDRVGLRVRFCKPIAQQHISDAGPERSTSMLRQTMNLNPPVPLDINQAKQMMGEGHKDELMEKIVALYQETAEGADVVVVEGLISNSAHPYADQLNSAMAEALDAEVILVSRLGNSTVAEMDERLELTGRLFGGIGHPKVLGVIVNKINVPREHYSSIGVDLYSDEEPTPAESLDQEQLIRTSSKLLGPGQLHLIGCIPWRQELISPRTIDIQRHFKALILHMGDIEKRRVTRFAVCARTVANVTNVFQPGVLIVAPGDRDDIILAACMAALSGLALAGILLTGNLHPSQRVLQLCEQALETGLPIFLVATDTYHTATQLQAFNTEIALDDRYRMEQVMDAIARRLDIKWLKEQCAVDREPRLSPPAFRYALSEGARKANKKIVLPEGDEPRTIQAAVICHERRIAHCVLIGEPDKIRRVAEKNGVTLPADLQIINPSAELRDQYVPPLVEMRKHKGLTPHAARQYLEDNVVLATVMLALDEVDGLVSGAVHTTANTIRPALQLIKTKKEAKLVSSIFFMCLPEQVLVYGDCAINPDPNAEELADIAIQSADSALAFGIPARVAMISYSTGSSGAGSEVEKVREATEIAKAKRPDLLIDGPLQYDAAAIADVASKKAPHSPVAGKATVFIFPDLNTGNTTYKAVQRSANVVSIGPMLQGLRKPVNDLSRGALVDDIVYTIALTAIQAQSVKP